MYNLLNNCSRVVLLGVSSSTKYIIKALNRDYGICPTVYSDKRPSGRFNILLHYKFVKQSFPSNDYCAVRSALDIIKTSNTGTCVVSSTESHFNNLVQNNMDLFEKECIVVQVESLTKALPSYKKSRPI